MSKLIAISNHKGGVGKTTSAINIGAGLNKLGKTVLLIDLDPQANLSQSLGIVDPERNIYGALRGEYKLQPIEILKGLCQPCREWFGGFREVPRTTAGPGLHGHRDASDERV
jgi:cellulose biosynthesis protein BcsQ